LFDLTAFSSAPYFFKPVFYSEGRWFLSNYRRTLENILVENKRSHNVTTSKKQDYDFVDDIQNKFQVGKFPGTFKFYHLTGCHFPIDTDENGQAFQEITNSRETYSKQCLGSLKLAIRLIGLLKKSNIMANTQVVIASDHGGGFPIVPESPTELSQVTGWLARAVPLLLIKNFEADTSKPLVIDERPAMLSDISNTLTEAAFGVAPFPRSISLFSQKYRKPDECREFWNTDGTLKNFHFFQRLEEYCISGHAWNLSSYKATGKVLVK
jgi:hypothetical protein